MIIGWSGGIEEGKLLRQSTEEASLMAVEVGAVSAEGCDDGFNESLEKKKGR